MLNENESLISGTAVRDESGKMWLVPSRSHSQSSSERLDGIVSMEIDEKFDLSDMMRRRGARDGEFAALSGTFFFRSGVAIQDIIISPSLAAEDWSGQIRERLKALEAESGPSLG